MASSGISTESAELSDAVQILEVCNQVLIYFFTFEVVTLSCVKLGARNGCFFVLRVRIGSIVDLILFSRFALVKG